MLIMFKSDDDQQGTAEESADTDGCNITVALVYKLVIS